MLSGYRRTGEIRVVDEQGGIEPTTVTVYASTINTGSLDGPGKIDGLAKALLPDGTAVREQPDGTFLANDGRRFRRL
jgi:hypothetical protein